MSKHVVVITIVLIVGFLLAKLKSLLQRIYDRHHNLVNRYGIYVFQMTMDMFSLSSSQCVPFLINDVSQSL